MQAKIGIIGGTGLYDPELLKNVKEQKVRTPYGPPSDSITVGELDDKQIAFLPRHSKKHTIRPTDVNSRANIFALKKIGVQRILAPSTVGSLREEMSKDRLESTISKLANTEDEKDAIRYAYKNVIVPTGDPEIDIENAHAIANKGRLKSLREEMNRKIISEATKSKGNGGAGQRLQPGIAEPKWSEKMLPMVNAMKARGFKWDGQRKKLVKRNQDNKIIREFDPYK